LQDVMSVLPDVMLSDKHNDTSVSRVQEQIILARTRSNGISTNYLWLGMIVGLSMLAMGSVFVNRISQRAKKLK
jgi:hypothetical protein